METSNERDDEAQGVQQQEVGGVTKSLQQAPSTLQLPFQQNAEGWSNDEQSTIPLHAGRV